MSENEKLQKLLRLKNYETPGEEYFENFLDELKERQRQDALRQSSVALFKERAVEWYRDLGPAKWAVPAGSFATLLVTFFALNGRFTEEPISENRLPGAGSGNARSEGQIIELQLPKNRDLPAEVAPNPESPFLPAGYREL